MDETRFDRIELKGTVAAGGRPELGRALRARMAPDEHGDGEGRYAVASLYYDTPDHDVYWDRMRGVPSRRKLRVRLYGSARGSVPPICFVEIKQKHFGRVAKRRLALDVDAALALCAGGAMPPGLGPADRLVADEVRALVADEALAPTCTIRYVRQAFRAPDVPDLRVTLDAGVRCSAAVLDPRQATGRYGVGLLPAGIELLEVKVDHAVPLWLVEAMGTAHVQPRSVSKYALACEALGLVHGPSAPISHPASRRGAARGDRGKAAARQPIEEPAAWIR